MLKRFKERYVKETTLYKLYRILKYRPRRTYASWSEDTIPNRIYEIGRFKKAKYKGRFVDIGCNHPIIGNTTYALYKKGWRGLNVDLTPNNIRLCRLLRARDVSRQCAISDHRGEIDSYIFDQGSGLNTLDKAAADEGALIIGKSYSIEKIQVMPLNDVIKETLGAKKIDLLNLDVEGHELPILKDFDFKTYCPDLITCEIHAYDIEAVPQSEVYKLIVANGYHCLSYYGATAIFARNDWDFKY